MNFDDVLAQEEYIFMDGAEPQVDSMAGSDYVPTPNLSEFTVIANRIRILAIGCKNRDALSCEFGNEFTPRVEAYLRECFDKPNSGISGKLSTYDRIKVE